MGLLNRFFASTEGVHQVAFLLEESIVRIWENYLGTLSEKKIRMGKLEVHNDLLLHAKALREILGLELVDIHEEEKEERKLIENIGKITHEKKIKRVHRLESCLNYAETRHEYVYRLLEQLGKILQTEMHLVSMLLQDQSNAEKIIVLIKEQYMLEEEIIKKIEKVPNFQKFFLALMKGEHIIHRMDEREKRLLKKMQTGIAKIFTNEITEGITQTWAMTVFDAIEENVHAAVEGNIITGKEIFSGYHPDMDFEYVNRPEFVQLVRETIYTLKGPHKNPYNNDSKIAKGRVEDIKQRRVSEQMINVFVHLFREWFNERE